jgi:hypothetical protein
MAEFYLVTNRTFFLAKGDIIVYEGNNPFPSIFEVFLDGDHSRQTVYIASHPAFIGRKVSKKELEKHRKLRIMK